MLAIRKQLFAIKKLIQIYKDINENILIAYASDGMRSIFKKEVSLISVWINGRCEHRVDDESVAALLKEAKETNKMQIYICDNNKLDGKMK